MSTSGKDQESRGENHKPSQKRKLTVEESSNIKGTR
jgi:hypothetical protein